MFSPEHSDYLASARDATTLNLRGEIVVATPS